MTHPIVVGYDGSVCSEDALRAAAELAEGGGRTLILVFCHEAPAGLSAELDPACAAAGELREYERCVEEDVEPVLEGAAERVRQAGIPAETEIVWDDCAAALHAVALRRGASLIVVGSHGEGALSAVFGRALCYRLVHGSSLPVLVVPRGKGKFAVSAAVADARPAGRR